MPSSRQHSFFLVILNYGDSDTPREATTKDSPLIQPFDAASLTNRNYPAQLSRLIGMPNTPVLIDVCIDQDFGDDPQLIPGALQHPADGIASPGQGQILREIGWFFSKLVVAQAKLECPLCAWGGGFVSVWIDVSITRPEKFVIKIALHCILRLIEYIVCCLVFIEYL